MRPYGLTAKEFSNDSKKLGDLFNGRKALSGISVRAYLRMLKKRERRNCKAEANKRWGEVYEERNQSYGEEAAL